ncbi:MAG: Rnase Y domain-containing protein, partial [Phycisphaerales bacterium]|nr:Rnase Y domain-containing protein [Phycisphaerales bacterium]
MPQIFMLANIFIDIGIGFGGLVVGGVGGWLFIRATTGGTIRLARRQAEQIIAASKTEGEAEKQKIELESERQVNKRRGELDSEIAEARSEIKKDQARIEKREDSLDNKLDQVAERQSKLDEIRLVLDRQTVELEESKASLDERVGELRTSLEKVSGMTTEEAKNQLLDEIRHDAEHDSNELIQQIVEDATEKARSKSREITLQAIQRFAAEHVAETTVRSVRIASDDMKGRVIGREGRNIRALEQATGVDILVDDTPGIISVSCFDPIRRAVAGRSLEKLVADGRVHPSRIEEVVETVRGDINDQILEKGNSAV